MNPSYSTTLHVRRFIAAPRARVFAAFTNPEDCVRWMGPNPDQCLDAKLDVRPGGKYEIRMKSPDGGEMSVLGEYLEVRNPERLVFTWYWEGDAWEHGPSQVTIDFLELDGGTDVQLVHEKLPGATSRDNHSRGWQGSLDKLLALCSPETKIHTCSAPIDAPAAGEFCWNELITSDPALADKFYTQLFGWTTAPFDGPVPYTIFQNGEKGVGGMMSQQEPGTPPIWLSYISVEDCDASVADVQRLGGKVCMPPKDIPTIGRIAVLADPLGTPFGIHQPEDK